MQTNPITEIELRRPAKVWAQIGVSAATGWRLAKNEPAFPKPIKIGSGRATAFVGSEVDDYIRGRIADARRAAA